MRRAIFRTGAIALGAFLWAASPAAAQVECATDTDCDEGFVCEEVGGSGCTAVACPPGYTCDPEPPCEPEVIMGCIPGPCETDADCGDDLECVTVTYDECPNVSTPDCPPDTDCQVPEPTEPECTTHEERFCAPPYVGSCDVAADCGDGFDCVDTEVCTCSGGGGSGGATPGAPPEPTDTGGDEGADPPADEPDGGVPLEEPTCGCEATGDRHCEPLEMECSSEADCPDGWSCDESGSSTAPCAIDSDGNLDCPEPEPATSYCMPPYWNQGFGYDEGGSAPALDRATGAEDPQVTSGGATGGNGESDTAGGMTGGGGCSAAPGRGGGWSFLLLAALAWIRRRRR